ncbi:uncharacterized protein PAC_12048 [Phialocephala subalpina]|uniref:Rhodopsin domain-containing protein n=1 Tax=Phialocephala subalpina TaxID=576137 RepID=A0A1L7XAV0_9HELO|nr:uncharacterized protein PAC_12048 [Phialocephala subalpina]
MPNDTSCSVTGTCTILTGTVTNGTDYVAQYNPNAPAPLWHQRMELATICVCNVLSFIIIVSRTSYRWLKFKRFRGDDRWVAFAGLILIPFTVSQIGTNVYGSGLYFVNVKTAWRPMHWHYLLGWVGYYIVVSSIKLSVCFCFLQILTTHHKKLRYCVYGLCAVIISLGLTMTISWMTNCKPFLSNFLWSVWPDSCINFDIFRYLWIGVSIPIDLAIMSVPLHILSRLKLRTHERRILKMVFCATLLGTITCTIGIYGAFETRTAEANEAFYQETAYVMMSDIEILMYTLGASFPVLSRYMVQKASPGPDQTHENFSSWARYVPNFFASNSNNPSSQHRTNNRTIILTRSRHDNNTTNTDERALKSPDTNGDMDRDMDVRTCDSPELQFKSSVFGSESGGSTGTSESGGSMGRDLESGGLR